MSLILVLNTVGLDIIVFATLVLFFTTLNLLRRGLRGLGDVSF
jgi:hypothetical protein